MESEGDVVGKDGRAEEWRELMEEEEDTLVLTGCGCLLDVSEGPLTS